MRPWILATLALPAGFAVAEITGVRPLGGAVLVVLALAAVLGAHAPLARSAGWAAVALACFVASHALADSLGTWGAIAAVTLVVGMAARLLLPDPGQAVHA